MTTPTPAAESRVLTLPNAITFVRALCVPWFLWLLFAQDDRGGAAVLLAVIGSTDWVDGYLARRLGQVSTVGKVLDPVVDRVALLVGVVAILVDGSVPLWFGVAALAREALVAVAGIVLAAMGARRIDVTWWGKAGTFGMYVAFPLFLAGASDFSWADTADVLAWVAGIPGLALAWYSAALYVPLAREALRDQG